MAIDYYEQALAIARKMGDIGGEGYALNNLGIVYASSGRLHTAIEIFKQQLAITNTTENLRAKCEVLGNLGNAYNALGEIGKSIESTLKIILRLRNILTIEEVKELRWLVWGIPITR